MEPRQVALNNLFAAREVYPRSLFAGFARPCLFLQDFHPLVIAGSGLHGLAPDLAILDEKTEGTVTLGNISFRQNG